MSNYKEMISEGVVDSFLLRLVSIFSKDESIADHVPELARLAKTDRGLARAISDLDASVKDMKAFLLKYRQINPEIAKLADKVPTSYLR